MGLLVARVYEQLLRHRSVERLPLNGGNTDLFARVEQLVNLSYQRLVSETKTYLMKSRPRF